MDGVPVAWNVEIFVQATKDLAPHLQWKEVVAELDHRDFYVNSKEGLKIIVRALSKALNEPFPIELIFRQWKNTEGQVIAGFSICCFIDFFW